MSLGRSELNSFQDGFIPKDEYKKKKELEEARKSGLAPSEVDEEGNDINPHIPQYIAKAPWYLSRTSRPSLKHQRCIGDTQQGSLHKWYQRGLIEQEPVLKYRKGACTNCGAISHNAKDCTDRPRKRGAKLTGTDIKPDELIVASSDTLQLDFDGKRDPYGGYDPATYKLVIRDYTLADLQRKRRKELELKEVLGKKQKNDNNADDTDSNINTNEACDHSSDSSSSYDCDEKDGDGDDVKVKEFDQTNAPVGMKDDRTRTTTMNLRIREDTAKYLFNLDVNSAFYDPKTRSMRDNPMKHLKESEQGLYRGDNYMRNTAEADIVKKMEIFAWEAYKHNVNVHPQSQPTQLELMHNEFNRKKKELVDLKKNNLLLKYGGEQHLNPPTSLILSQTETFCEYNPVDGSIKKNKNRIMEKSKYQDDVLYGEHSQVWGSWYDRNKNHWGYACCHQFDKTNPVCDPL